jgi:predicted Zn-dependent peptidase
LYIDFYTARQFTQREKVALQLLSTMLTETMYSRIFGTAREKGWVYGMGSGSSYARDLSSWWLGAQVSKTNSQPLLRLVRDELLRLKNGEIDDEDFESARKNLLGKTMRSGQTASGLVSRYGQFYIDDTVDNLNLLPQITKRISKKVCIDLVQELLASNTWGMGVLGSTSLVPARKLRKYIEEVFEQG